MTWPRPRAGADSKLSGTDWPPAEKMCSVLFHFVPFRSWEAGSCGAVSEHLWNTNGAVSGQQWNTNGTRGQGLFEGLWARPGPTKKLSHSSGGSALDEQRAVPCGYNSTSVLRMQGAVDSSLNSYRRTYLFTIDEARSELAAPTPSQSFGIAQDRLCAGMTAKRYALGIISNPTRARYES